MALLLRSRERTGKSLSLSASPGAVSLPSSVFSAFWDFFCTPEGTWGGPQLCRNISKADGVWEGQLRDRRLAGRPQKSMVPLPAQRGPFCEGSQQSPSVIHSLTSW